MDRTPPQSGSSGDDQRGTSAKPAPTDTASLAGMGVQFLVAILLFLFIGKWLDSRLGTSPWLLILGVFVGAAGGVVAMYRKVFPPEKPKSSRGNRPGSV